MMPDMRLASSQSLASFALLEAMAEETQPGLSRSLSYCHCRVMGSTWNKTFF